jgi:large subunit ribosomal protein L6
MSRIGKQPIEIPSEVTVSINDSSVSVKGPKAELSVSLPPKVTVAQRDNQLIVSVPQETDSRQAAFWGLGRSLIANAIEGVTSGFEKKLEINGVGYKVQLKGRILILNVGYSHSVEFPLPEGIEAQVEGNVITISGASKQLVGEITSQIRAIRKPEPYKGKGIKYSDEIVRRKVGKVVKGAEA